MTTGKYIVSNDLKFISVKGEDCKEVLQGIVTNDVNKCEKKVIYSCLLSPQGKFLADFFIIPNKESLLIEINKKYFEDFIKKINIYKLRSKIDVSEINNISTIIIFNSLINNFKEGTILENKNYIEYVDPRNVTR